MRKSSKNLNSQVDFDKRIRDASPSLSLADCLDNIQTYVQFELKPLLNFKEEREKEKQKQIEQEARLKAEQEARKKAQQLEEYLKNQQWYEADQETWKLMLKVTNREEEGWLDLENIKNFPSEDL
ncbi:MAG: GUN4 domain-containing protein [Flammeovirgaceae bacterium]